MLRGGDVKELNELKRQGLSITQISALTGFDRKTVRKYLEDPATPGYGPRSKRAGKLDPFQPYIEERLAAGVWNAVVLLRELKERGYNGGYSILSDYLRPLRQEARAVAVRRFETAPGQQAQLDWGTIGHLETEAGKKTLYALVLTLGHSRAMFAEAATDTRLPTLLRLHEAAFAELGGVPREILYDRMKTVILGMDERGEIRWQPLFQDFASYWGFVPRACRAYRPQTKGKVESGVGYVKKNFLCGRAATDLLDLRCQLASWVWQVANQRLHGTTQRHVWSAWQEEKRFLIPITGRVAYPFIDQEPRKVSRDAFVSFRGNRYSVPWQVAGQEVLVHEVEGQLQIERGGETLAVHPMCPNGARQSVAVAAHHADIPLDGGLSNSPYHGKARIVVRSSVPGASTLRASTLPEVEVRSLQAYELIYQQAQEYQQADEREVSHE